MKSYLEIGTDGEGFIRVKYFSLYPDADGNGSFTITPEVARDMGHYLYKHSIDADSQRRAYIAEITREAKAHSA